MSSKLNKLEININNLQNINQPKKPNFEDPEWSMNKEKEKSNDIELDSLSFERTKEEDDEIRKLEKIYEDKLKEIEHLTHEIKLKDDEIILMNNAKNKIYNIGSSNSGEENIDINNIIKFGIENIVNKDEKNLDKYACSECNKLLYHPQKCMKCGKNYCSDCIKINNEKNKKCKFCDGNEFETSAALVFDLINNIKVYCDICKKELNYESALNHVHQ